MNFAPIITQLKLPKHKYLTDDLYLYYKKAGWWGKKILDQVSRRAIDANWIWLGMEKFTNNDKTFGFIEKFELNGMMLTLSEVYHEKVHNSQFIISLVKV
jgi:hypothetical protein